MFSFLIRIRIRVFFVLGVAIGTMTFRDQIVLAVVDANFFPLFYVSVTDNTYHFLPVSVAPHVQSGTPLVRITITTVIHKLVYAGSAFGIKESTA